MDESNQDGSEVLETTEVDDTTETEEEELTPEAIEDLKAKAAKADELEEKNKQLYERAKKAEAKGTSPAPAPEVPKALSASDIVALSKIHEDDIERVERFAKSEGLSIKDALKNSELKAILSVRAEERESAEVANTGPVRRGAQKTTDAALLQAAKAGRLPDSDEEIARLVKAKSKE